MHSNMQREDLTRSGFHQQWCTPFLLTLDFGRQLSSQTSITPCHTRPTSFSQFNSAAGARGSGADYEPTWQMFTPAWHVPLLGDKSIVLLGSTYVCGYLYWYPFWRLASHQRSRLASQKVTPLYQRNLLGGWFIPKDPLHGGVRRS